VKAQKIDNAPGSFGRAASEQNEVTLAWQR
jgi:hypothetical protein